MTKTTSNFFSVKRVASRTPFVVALCAGSLLCACGNDSGNDSPTAPTQAIDDAHITVTNLRLSPEDFAYCVRGTMQNTGSATLVGRDGVYMFLGAIFHNNAGRLGSGTELLDGPFAPGEQRLFEVLVETAEVEGWTHFRMELSLDATATDVVECTGCDSRRVSVGIAECSFF